MPLMRYFSILMLAFLLTACGGGGSIQKDTDNGDDGSDGTYAITLSGEGGANSVSSDTPLKVTATLTKNGSALANSRVVFESDDFATMEPSSGSVLTNDAGEATITLKATNVEGAGRISATYTNGSNSVTQTFDFISSGDGDGDSSAVAKLEVMLLDCPSGWDDNRDQDTLDPISEGCEVINQISSNDSAEIFIKLTSNQTGEGVANALVSAEATLGTIIPSTGTALTDNFGVAILRFQPGNQGGAGTITVNSPDYVESGPQLVRFDVGVAEVNVAIDNGLAGESLSAGGSTIITVALTDEEDKPIESALEVTFSSVCSTVTPALAELDETVKASNGIARSTYRAKGCQGEDRIFVTVQNGSTPINGETSIQIDSALAQAIQFLPEEDGFNQFIALPPGEGGLPTQSVVSFKLVDEDNLAIPRARVDFRLSDEQGLASLTQITGNTNANGIVRTTVKSGIVPGPLVVSACYIPEESYANLPEGDAITCWTDIAKACNERDASNDDSRCPTGTMRTIPLSEQIFSVSSQLILSSGVTDQDTFDAAPDIINSNSYSYSGVTTNITLFFGDQFNHFNADGVAATVIAEAGAIGSLESPDTYDCRTNKATCSVVWRSQGERPFSDPKWGNRINDIPPRVRANLTGNETNDELDEKRNCNLYFNSPAPCINGLKRQKNAPSTGTDPDADERVVMGGRVGILAFVKGQESFRDEESDDENQRRNGLFDVGEYRQEFDLTEAILDTNENGQFDKENCDASSETGPCTPENTKNGGHDDWWIDANNNGLFDYDADNDQVPGDGMYNGLLCSEAALAKGQCNRQLVNVFRNFELVMSQDHAYVRFAVRKDEAKDMGLTEGELDQCQNIERSDSNPAIVLKLEKSDHAEYCDIEALNLAEGKKVDDDGNQLDPIERELSQIRIHMFISDINGNPLPAGTEVEISTTNGELASGTIASSVGNTSTDKPLFYSALLVPETEPNNKRVGELTIKFTFPGVGDDDEGKVQSRGITVNDAG